MNGRARGMALMRKHSLSFVLVASLCAVAFPAVCGADADPCAVLRDAFERSPVGWIKIHAADALVVADEGSACARP